MMCKRTSGCFSRPDRVVLTEHDVNPLVFQPFRKLAEDPCEPVDEAITAIHAPKWRG